METSNIIVCKCGEYLLDDKKNIYCSKCGNKL